MSWNLSTSGQATDADEEARVVDVLRGAVRACNAKTATLKTQHHGNVKLLDDDESE